MEVMQGHLHHMLLVNTVVMSTQVQGKVPLKVYQHHIVKRKKSWKDYIYIYSVAIIYHSNVVLSNISVAFIFNISFKYHLKLISQEFSPAHYE